MAVGITVQKAANHPLVRHVGLRGMSLEEVDALFAQREGDLDPVILQDKLIGWREEVIHNLYAA